jgi:hypothetical protein
MLNLWVLVLDHQREHVQYRSPKRCTDSYDRLLTARSRDAPILGHTLRTGHGRSECKPRFSLQLCLPRQLDDDLAKLFPIVK